MIARSVTLVGRDGEVRVIPNVHRHAAIQIARSRLKAPVEKWEAAFTLAPGWADIPLILDELALIAGEIGEWE